MDALILFAHGSLLCGAGETVKAHAERLRARGEFTPVEIAFLNYSEPTFEQAAARCIEAGAARIVVAPYFLVPGKFVTVNLPERIAAAREIYPHVEIIVAEPIGYDPALADAVLELASEARSPEAWRDALRQAAALCELDAECPLYGTANCPRVVATSGAAR